MIKFARKTIVFLLVFVAVLMGFTRANENYVGTPYGIAQGHPALWFSVTGHVSSGMRKKNVERYDRFIALSPFLAGADVILCGDSDLYRRFMFGLSRVRSLEGKASTRGRDEILTSDRHYTRVEIGEERQIFYDSEILGGQKFITLSQSDFLIHSGPC